MSQNGDTALIKAMIMGHTTIIRLLLDAGADTEAKNFVIGSSALVFAHALKHRNVDEMVDLLLQAGADANAVNHVSLSPINIHFSHIYKKTQRKDELTFSYLRVRARRRAVSPHNFPHPFRV